MSDILQVVNDSSTLKIVYADKSINLNKVDLSVSVLGNYVYITTLTDVQYKLDRSKLIQPTSSSVDNLRAQIEAFLDETLVSGAATAAKQDEQTGKFNTIISTIGDTNELLINNNVIPWVFAILFNNYNISSGSTQFTSGDLAPYSIVFFQVNTTNIVSGTVTIQLQESTDNVVYTDYGTALTGLAGTTVNSIKPNTSFGGRYLRAVLTRVSGATGTLTGKLICKR